MESEKQDRFSQFFLIVSLWYQHTLSNKHKHRNPITEKGDILVLQKLVHSIYDLDIVSKMATRQEGFEFRKQEII